MWQSYIFALITTPYIRSYMLVLMSLERFLAMQGRAQAMTRPVAFTAVVAGVIVVCLANSPFFFQHGVVSIESVVGRHHKTVCIEKAYDYTQYRFYRFVSRLSLWALVGVRYDCATYDRDILRVLKNLKIFNSIHRKQPETTFLGLKLKIKTIDRLSSKYDLVYVPRRRDKGRPYLLPAPR